jgi:hypothetical protein
VALEGALRVRAARPDWFTARTTTWNVEAGGRIGRAIGEDAVEAAAHITVTEGIGALPASRNGLVLNRMSPSAWTRGHANAIFHTLHFLA